MPYGSDDGTIYEDDLSYHMDFPWVDEGDKTPNEIAAKRVKAGVNNPPDRSNLPKLVQAGGPFSPARMVSEVANAAVDGPQLLKDVAEGTVDPTSDEALARLNNVTSVIGGTALATAPMRPGLGMFGGISGAFEQSGSGFIKRLDRAYKMETSGADPQKIWNETGWFRGADDHWRFEINDQNARLRLENMQPTEQSLKNFKKYWDDKEAGKPVDWMYRDKEPQLEWQTGAEHFKENKIKLEDILDHPELYKAYPELRDVKILPEKMFNMFGATRGYFDPETKGISLSRGDEMDMLSTLLHEVQHWVQDREGFAKGGNTEMFAKDPDFHQFKTNNSNLKSLMDDLVKERGLDPMKYKLMNAAKLVSENKKLGSYYQEAWNEVEKHPDIKAGLLQIARDEKIIHDTEKDFFDKYLRLAGEAEARMVQESQFLTDAERKARDPRYPSDLGPNATQIVQGVSMSPR